MTTIFAATFAIAGVCVALAGLVQAASITSANLAGQGTLTFDATAAAVVGATPWRADEAPCRGRWRG